jgi:colicin import membrane protein
VSEQPLSRPSEPNIARHLLFSLALHAAVIGLFSGALFTRPRPQPRPVYYVDLSRLPVADPQAGRPDGGTVSPARHRPKPKPKPVPKPKAPPATPKTAPKAQTPKAEPSTKAAPKARPARTVAKAPAQSPPARPARTSADKGSRPAPAADGSDYSTVRQRLARMRRKQQHRRQVAALKDKIAALSSDKTATGSAAGRGAGIPLGAPDGRGSDIGVDQETWLKAFYKENWRLSKYQISRLDLEATVSITYDAEGRLINYRFIKPSGDGNFDDSVKKAILKEKVLPFKPGRPLQLDDIVFNLKDLMD